MNNLPDFGAIIMERAAARIKVYPHASNRASEVGHECERFLVLSRTSWQEKKPINPTLQRIFDLGNLIEYGVLKDLADAGITFIEQQRSFQDKGLQLTGHIDGKVMVENATFPAEVKGLAHNTWQTFPDFAVWTPESQGWRDMINHNRPWIRKYPGQLTMYMYLDNKEYGVFLLFSKQTFEPKCIWIELDYEYAESLVQKLERVNAHIEADTLPEQINDAEMCIDCDFFHICLPEIRRTALDFSDDPELEQMIARWQELAPMKSEYEAIDKKLKKRLEGCEKAVIGDYLITGKLVERKGYAVEPSSYWQKKIARLSSEA